MLNSEEWKVVAEFPEFLISSEGEVKRRGGKHLSMYQMANGYWVVSFNIREHQHPQKRLIHRVVAQAFIPNPDGKPTVNHLDGDKSNNRCVNLEWATHAENHQHAYATGLRTYNNPTRGLKLAARSNSAKLTIYSGVCWVNSRQRWVARVVFEGKVYGQKRFLTEKEAAVYRDQIVKECNLPLKLNFT